MRLFSALLFSVGIVMVISLTGVESQAASDPICPVCKNTDIRWRQWSCALGWQEDPMRFCGLPDSHAALITCQLCGFTAFVQDYHEVSKDKVISIAAITKDLPRRRVPILAEEGGVKSVTMGPEILYDMGNASQVLLAERIYKVLDKNASFWCNFYLYKAKIYCEADPKVAKRAREQALEYASTCLSQEESQQKKRYYFVIVGLVKFLLGDVQDAENEFLKAIKIRKASVKPISRDEEQWDIVVALDCLELIREKKCIPGPCK
jgi:hypothetical protein